jgi:O-antigen/teichoic acid export membrane protein
MSPFRSILKLSIGDFVAKAAYFLSFVYVAQRLGVAGYGVLEFAIAIRTYLLLLADAGLELWAMREAAKGVDVRTLAARVIPARLVLAAIALSSTALLLFIPGAEGLRTILPLLTLPVLVQAFNLKWAFLGQERMMRVATGLVVAQLAFAACVFALVHGPADLMLMPVAFLVSELVIAGLFWRHFVRQHGVPIPFRLGNLRSMMRPALTMGATQCLGLVNYNVDSILIGVMLGASPVGWYAAAYKPVTAILAAPVTYFMGLFPVLSRYQGDPQKLRAILIRSLRFSAIFAIPVGVGGMLLAEPVILLLFGESYRAAVPPLQILSWSAALITLRGTFRHALNAAGRQRNDLNCAIAAAAINVGLNLVLIPLYGIVGAAAATLVCDICWLLLAVVFFSKHIMTLPLLAAVWRPLLAGAGMAACLIGGTLLPWMWRAAISVAAYLTILIASGEPELKLALSRQAWRPQLWRAAGGTS